MVPLFKDTMDRYFRVPISKPSQNSSDEGLSYRGKVYFVIPKASSTEVE